jgi:hypothetical protein
MQTNNEINQLLHDADRAVMGANFARQMGDRANAALLDRDAIAMYRQALNGDVHMTDPAWGETFNRDPDWLNHNGFARIAALSIGSQK